MQISINMKRFEVLAIDGDHSVKVTANYVTGNHWQFNVNGWSAERAAGVQLSPAEIEFAGSAEAQEGAVAIAKTGLSRYLEYGQALENLRATVSDFKDSQP